MKYFIMSAKNRLSGTPLTDLNTKAVWKTFQISTQTTSEKYPSQNPIYLEKAHYIPIKS